VALDEFEFKCGVCGRTTPIPVVDEFDELTAEERAAADEVGRWFERFNEEADEYEGRCPDCVPDEERHLWTLVSEDALAEHDPSLAQSDSVEETG
jgi:hypothetical protein